jgi:hypothetical protein
MCRAPNSLFCGNHRPVTETESLPSRVLKKAKKEGQSTVIRIPCPIDNTHTIFQHDLEHHMAICNTAARTAEMQSQPYYCENCNSGFNIDSISSSCELSIDCDDLVKKIHRIYNERVAPFVHEPAKPTDVIPKEKIMQAVAGVATSFGRLRHAEQDVNIVEQMMAAKLLEVEQQQYLSTPFTFVELGAG